MGKKVLIYGGLGIIALVIIAVIFNRARNAQNTLNPQPENVQQASLLPGATATSTESSTASPSSQVKEFSTNASNFKYEPNQMTVKVGDTVKITIKNIGGTHDFVIDEFSVKTPQTQTNQETTVEFVADKKGQFQFYCSVGNHRQQGMVGTLIVE